MVNQQTNNTNPLFRTERADWYFIIPATIIWLSGLAVTAWDFIYLQKATFHFGIVNALGLSLIAGGVAMRLLARKALGRQFTHGLRTLGEHRLVTSGVYKNLRHPAYTGLMLIHPGTALLLGSGYGFLVMLLLIFPILYRIRIEEEMLVRRFGDRYINYRQRTKKANSRALLAQQCRS